MECSSMVQALTWYSQGHSITSEARVLSLKCFDMILGEDWLEEVSPMWVDWRKKKIKFTYQGVRITLNGLTDDISQCPAVSARKLIIFD